jgi:hypothetical protein
MLTSSFHALTHEPNEEDATMSIQGFKYLNKGSYGTIFVSDNGMSVLKVFDRGGRKYDKEGGVRKEYLMFTILSQYAPEYIPAPCTLTRVTSNDIPAIQMINVGNSIQDRPITGVEIGLCILQSIHFVLLVSAHVKMKDVHEGNICTRYSGPDISLHFIDFGSWTEAEDAIAHNSNVLFWDWDQSTWLQILDSLPDNEVYTELLTLLENRNACVHDGLLYIAMGVQRILGTQDSRVTERMEDILRKIYDAFTAVQYSF